MKIGFLGPEGSYTHDAALSLFSGDTFVPLSHIEAVFEALVEYRVDRAVVPYENVIQGPVTETLDGLYRHTRSVEVQSMVVRSIEHAIGALPSHGEIRQVLSKDQALAQCSKYLSQHYASATQVATSSTSFAMERIVKEQLSDAAAIGSPLGLSRYGLKVLASNIGNVNSNKTRFAVLAPRGVALENQTGNDATAVVVYPYRNRVGFLEDLIEIISTRHRLNLWSIHSRPDARGAFRFYLELEGHARDPRTTECLRDIEEQFAGEDVEVHTFGSFPRSAFNEPQIRSIGIIGGTGAMGYWFRTFFEDAGLSVSIAGRQGPITYDACVRQSDVVIINVPIENTVDVIRQIAPLLQSGQLIVDNTSVKTGPVRAMLEAAPEGVEVIGMHTIFGPSIQSVRGQNVVFTPTARSGGKAEELETLFYRYGARITRTTPENHDRHMAFHQNLEHVSKVVLASLFNSFFESPEERLAYSRYSTPNSRASLATMGRILKSDPHLLGEIQANNQEARMLLERYVQTCSEISNMLLEGRIGDFEVLVRRVGEALGAELLDALKSESVASDKGQK